MNTLRPLWLPQIAPLLAAVMLVLGLGGPAQCLAMLQPAEASAICYGALPHAPNDPDGHQPQNAEHACPICHALGAAVSAPGPELPGLVMAWTRITQSAPAVLPARPQRLATSQQPRAPPVQA